MYKIDISERTLHFKQPAGTSRGVYTTRHSYYLTLTSDELPGVEGVGECATPLISVAMPNRNMLSPFGRCARWWSRWDAFHTI